MRITIAIVAALLGAASTAQAQDAVSSDGPPAAAQEENSGQDPTKPVTRFDIRLKYANNPGGFDAETLTLRVDKPFVLGGGWQLSTRTDLPVMLNNTVTPGNPAGDTRLGLSDTLIQGLLLAPPSGKWDYGFGTQLLIPTGTDDQFTTGKWQIVPTAVVVYQLPKLSRGSFIGLLLRDAISFAGNADRADINVVSVQPLFNWQLKNQWFATFAPEMKLDTKDSWRVFLPFDVTVGKKIGPATVISLQGDIGLIKDYPQYDWQLEARVGFFF